jgi:hypothetical protein
MSVSASFGRDNNIVSTSPAHFAIVVVANDGGTTIFPVTRPSVEVGRGEEVEMRSGIITIAGAQKTVSRRHLKFEYSSEHGQYQCRVLGKNGVKTAAIPNVPHEQTFLLAKDQPTAIWNGDMRLFFCPPKIL